MQDHELYDVNIAAIKPLQTPRQLIRAVPVSAKARASVLQGRKQVIDIVERRDDRLMIIAGPCSVHDERAALDYAERLQKLSERVSDRILLVMRVYFDKPRTTVGWKGLISDPQLDGSFDSATGLRLAREIMLQIAELGIPIATEFVNTNGPQYFADFVSWDALGARTTESQTHREVCSGLSMAVGAKNGTGGNEYSIQIAANAIVAIARPHTFMSVTADGMSAEVDTKGNPWGHLVLRGGYAGTNYDPASIAKAASILDETAITTGVVVDCSHDNSRKDHTKQSAVFRNVVEQRLAGNKRIVGIMIESNINAGAQKLGDHSTLKYGVSITDACIGWDETESLLRWAHGQLVGNPAAVPAD